MTNEEKIDRAHKLAGTIELIEHILIRIKRQKKIYVTKEKDDDIFFFGGLLQRFFHMFQPELESVKTPEEYDLEVLTLVEDFYEEKRRELEHELITL